MESNETKWHFWNWLCLLKMKDFWKNIGKNCLLLLVALLDLGLNIITVYFFGKALENNSNLQYEIYALITSTFVSMLISSITTFHHGFNSIKAMFLIVMGLISGTIFIMCTFYNQLKDDLSDGFYSMFLSIIIGLSIAQFFYMILCDIEFKGLKNQYLIEKQADLITSQPNKTEDFES